MTKLSLRIAANVLVSLSRLKEQLVLRWCSLLLEGLQKHGRVEAIWSGLADEVIGGLVLILAPVVLDRKPLQSLSSSESSLNSVLSALEIVLRLVKDGVRLQNAENLGVALQHLLCEEKVGELINIDGRLGALLLEKLRSLRT